jgi:hypothetical protein
MAAGRARWLAPLTRTRHHAETRPGDIVLIHGQGWRSAVIRYAQRLWFRGSDRTYTYWDHVAMFVDTNGGIIEAVWSGVCHRHIAMYASTDYQVVPLAASPEERAEAVRRARAYLHQPYGWLLIASIVMPLMAHTPFRRRLSRQQTCSSLIAHALAPTHRFTRAPAHVMPADLAKYCGVGAPVPVARSGQARQRTPLPLQRETLVNLLAVAEALLFT